MNNCKSCEVPCGTNKYCATCDQWNEICGPPTEPLEQTSNRLQMMIAGSELKKNPTDPNALRNALDLLDPLPPIDWKAIEWQWKYTKFR